MVLPLRLHARALRVLFVCLGILSVAGLTACGDSSLTPTTVSLASQVMQASDATDVSASPTSAAVQLSPAFTTVIHDYVIQCANSPTILITVTLPTNVAIGFIDPSGASTIPAMYSSGQFQKTMTISPGQRFQFSLSGQDDNYSVRCLPANFPPLTASYFEGNAAPLLELGVSPLPQAQWYVFAPDVQMDPSPYVVIADAHGTPVWWKSEPLGDALDAKVLNSNQIVWTTITGGQYYIHDFAGNLLNTLTGNLDFHELQLTPAGTFLAIRYIPRICPPDCADMSPWGGSSQAAVIDAQIVEMDSNSNILWTWNTRDHIALSETGNAGWYPGVGSDIIHMNAVEPDGTDALLFSARHLNAIYHITKSTGAIDWKIGGTTLPESLVVTGDTRPTALGPNGQSLSGQHDVRKWSDGTVSVHDNGTIANRPPFVVRYQIDTSSRTAEVVEEFSDSRVPASGCCGSARRLPNGHWLVNWGEQPFFTEIADGVPVLSVKYSNNGIFSYRSVPVPAGMVSASTLRDGMDAMAAAP